MGDEKLTFSSRRSAVVCKNGCVACSQPLAAQIGLDILKSGGNAADAAVGVAAALNVTEPCSTGIGGDAFCLFYDASTRKVHGLNGSGRSPAALTLERVREDGLCGRGETMHPNTHGHSVTVPGAAAAWVDTVAQFGSGKLSLSQILRGAITLAEEGFPVQQITSHFWKTGAEALIMRPGNDHGKDMLIDGRAPKSGEIMRMSYLAQTLKDLGERGRDSFYEGRRAQAIVDAVRKFGGVMTLDDLANHSSTAVDPINVDYKGFRVWETPPNGQGIAALMALNILREFDLKGMGHNSAEYIHTLVDALRLSFADTSRLCTDPSVVKVPVEQMLCKDYAAKRRQLIQTSKALEQVQCGLEWAAGDTVYFTTADRYGNACSFINSNFGGFGTGIVPERCGFTLQNRGSGFSLEPGHPNVLAPNKRPYHTIIPAMVTSTETGELLMSYGVMGGLMQPQGHVQVLLNMAEFGMDPQQSLDQPRFLVGNGYVPGFSEVSLEEGIDEQVARDLEKMGHTVVFPVKGYERCVFGRGQVITQGAWWEKESVDQVASTARDVYWTGSDPRADGCAAGY